jgi:hypothetical protein
VNRTAGIARERLVTLGSVSLLPQRPANASIMTRREISVGPFAPPTFFATVSGPGTGLDGAGRCRNLPRPVRYRFDRTVVYLYNNSVSETQTYLCHAIEALPGLDQWLRDYGSLRWDPYEAEMFFAFVYNRIRYGRGVYIGPEPNGTQFTVSSHLRQDAVVQSLPKWSDAESNALADWLVDAFVAGRPATLYTSPNSAVDPAGCPESKARAYSTSVFAAGGARASTACAAQFSCGTCPTGRTGNACQTMRVNATGWEAATEARESTYGIAHAGTRCQSRVGTINGVILVDLASGLDCGDVDTSGRFGCINGVYNWQTERCDCDPGWSRPADLGTLFFTSSAATWRSSAYYASYFGCTEGSVCATSPVANPFYTCVLPVGTNNVSCSSNLTGVTASDCIENRGACRQCNGRGVCLGASGCDCFPGFYGRFCDRSVETLCTLRNETSGVPQLPLSLNGSAPLSCSGHGTCTVGDLTCNCGAPGVIDPSCCTITAKCACVSGRGYGWSGLNCSIPFVQSITDTLGGGCLNNGTMRADSPALANQTDAPGAGHRVWCECPFGWTGLRCEISMCPLGPNGIPCNGHGTCTADPRTGEATCQSTYRCTDAGVGCRFGLQTFPYSLLNNRSMCVEPGGLFTNEHPPLRWRGAACEIDSYATCAMRIPVNHTSGFSGWAACTTPTLGFAPANPAVSGDGCSDEGNPGVYRCDCSAFNAGLRGPLCDTSPCISPASPNQEFCSGFTDSCKPGANNVSFCDCLSANPFVEPTPDVFTKSEFQVLRAGTYCERDMFACGAMYRKPSAYAPECLASRGSNGKWFCNGANETSGAFGFYTCYIPGVRDPVGGGDYRGVCKTAPSGGLACYCADGVRLCTDNSCVSCVNATAPTSAPTTSPTRQPTVAVPPGATGVPTAVPTRAPTAATVVGALSFAAATGNSSCAGGASGRFCMSTRGAIEPLRALRSGALTNLTVTYVAVPPFERIGLILNGTSGIVSGRPNASGTFVFDVTATVAGTSSTAAALHHALLTTSVFTTSVTVEVQAVCDPACPPASSVSCNTLTGTAAGQCVCRGIWFTANASAPCAAHPCLGTALPNQAGTACACADPRLSPALGCAASGCPSDPETGELCGKSVQTSAVQQAGGVDPTKECINRVCSCPFPYTRNASTGLCDAQCDLTATASVRNGACVCAVNTPEPRSPESGCRLPWCYHGAAFSVNGTGCICPFPFNGTSCASVTNSRCACSACMNGGALSCTPGLYNATCDGGGATPTCVCPAMATGDRCETSLCDGSRGGTISADGATCKCASPVWGGAFCNTSTCLNGGTPSWSTASNSWVCACPDGYAAEDQLCAGGTCAANAVADANGRCRCVFPFGGSGCSTNLCQRNVYAGRFGNGVLAGATEQCACLNAPRWRGKYCNISFCGALGSPVPITNGALPILPSGCSCLSGVATYDTRAAADASLWGCRHVTNCNGGKVNSLTGGCACGLGDDPLCLLAPPVTVAPTGAPTAAPTGAPSTSTPTTRSPTSSPSTAPPTRQPTSAPTTATTPSPSTGKVNCDGVNPENKAICNSTTGGSTGTTPIVGAPLPPVSNTTPPSEAPVNNTPSSAVRAFANALTILFALAAGALAWMM